MKPPTNVLCRNGAHGKRIARVAIALAITFLVSSPAPGQLINGRLISSVYTWEKFDTVGSSRKVTRGYLSGIFDIGQGSFSLHTHFQAASELKRQLDELPDYRLYYLYARMKDIAGFADLSLGRLPYFAGVGLGTVDGGQASLRFAANTVKLTMYGGVNVPVDMTVKGYGSVSNNFVVGGQLVSTVLPDMRASLSYMNRRRERASYWTVRPDPSVEALPMLIAPPPEEEEYAGLDVSYKFNEARFYGRYDYDLNLKQTQRGQAGVRYTFSPRLFATADFLFRNPRIPYNSIFSVFEYKSITEYEAGVDYFVTPVFRAFVRGAYVQYSGDRSFRYTAGIGNENLELRYRGNTGYAGELNTVTLQGAYPLFDNRVVPNAAFTYTRYRLDKNAGKESAIAGALGTTLRFIQALSVDLQGQWVNNILYKSDFRFFGKINFWFSERLNLLD
ncbi:hypothetical protein EHM92_08455 [bacterium]|nr:MAG: hypothetical protein EHM92_08455 [bacterium]